jgi:hypothetical protein
MRREENTAKKFIFVHNTQQIKFKDNLYSKHADTLDRN